MRIPRTTIALSAIPLLFAGICWIMSEVRGPHNLGENIDPSYVLLFNSLNLASAKPSFYYQHPATTMQIASAAILASAWAARRAGGEAAGFADDAVANHLEYLNAINIVHLALLIVAAFWAGRTVHRLTGSMTAAALLQATPLMFLMPVESLPRVIPEHMELVIEFALIIPLAAVLFARDPERIGLDPKLAIAAGALVGAGIATKANFFTLGLLVLLFPGWRQKMRFATAAAAALAILMAPLIFVWRDVLKWYFGMATRAGLYGKGERGLPSAAEYWQALQRVYQEEPFLILLGLCYLAAFVAVWRRGSGLGARRKTLARGFLAGLLVILAHTLITAKHFNYHYLVPAFFVAIFLNAALAVVLQSGGLPRNIRVALLLLCVWTGYEAFRMNWGRLQWYAGWKREYREQIAAVTARREAMEGCRVAGYYRSSAPTFALRFGNDLAGQLQHAALERVYPGQVHLADGQFRHWNHASANEELVRELEAGGCVLVQGAAAARPAVEGFVLEPVYEPDKQVYGAEALFRLRLAAGAAGSESPGSQP